MIWHDMTWRYAVNQYAVAQLGGHRGSDRSPRGMLANSKGSTRRTTTYYDVHGAELLLQVFGAEFHVAPAPTAHQATSSYALMTRMYRIPMHRWQNDTKIHIVERLVTQWDVAPCVMRLGPAKLTLSVMLWSICRQCVGALIRCTTSNLCAQSYKVSPSVESVAHPSSTKMPSNRNSFVAC